MNRPLIRISIIFAISGLLLIFILHGQRFWVPAVKKITRVSVEYVIDKYGEDAEQRLTPYFQASGISYPPKTIKLLALKQEKVLELWAENNGNYKWVRNYKIKAASGISGPKLREGDHQVPEGFYKIIGLNPNSSFHLSLKLDYPNEFDLQKAKQEGRTSPGSDIFIHGRDLSVGCLAMGDPEIEELFTLVHQVGKSNVDVVITPKDPRKHSLKPSKNNPQWVANLYEQISEEFSKYKTSNSGSTLNTSSNNSTGGTQGPAAL